MDVWKAIGLLGIGVLFAWSYGEDDVTRKLEILFGDSSRCVLDEVWGVAGAGEAIVGLVGYIPVPVSDGIFFAVGYTALDIKFIK